MQISVVTPTLGRPLEVEEMLVNLAGQSCLPAEAILIDGAAQSEVDTERVVERLAPELPFRCRYLRRGGGTAVQRNHGIDAAVGGLVAFIDDDIRLEPDFLAQMAAAFAADAECLVGGITGYIDGAFLDPERSPRWRWYRRLRLFSTYEPGRYDYASGYPINRYLQPPHDRLREVDFMGAGCAVWRREVFAKGLRFAEFFAGFGVLEDAHLALRAGREWRLLENGRARCVHLRSPRSRENLREVARKSALNYRYVFVDLVPQRTWGQEARFWRVQLFDLLRIGAQALRRPERETLGAVAGKLQGMVQALRLASPHRSERREP